MKKYFVSCLFLLSTLLFLISCSQSTGPQGSTMVGHVILINTNGSQPANRSGVKVLVSGTSDSIVTDENGQFELPVNKGVYTLLFSKTGYNSTRVVDTLFPGGGQYMLNGDQFLLRNVTLCQPPTFHVSKLTVTLSGTSLNVSDSITDTTSIQRRLVVFLGKSSGVSSNPANYFTASSFNQTFTRGGSTTGTVFALSQSTLRTMGFAAGDSVWLVTYAANEYATNLTYPDIATGRTWFANLNATPSNVVPMVSP